jgi:hypothetical protein
MIAALKKDGAREISPKAAPKQTIQKAKLQSFSNCTEAADVHSTCRNGKDIEQA